MRHAGQDVIAVARRIAESKDVKAELELVMDGEATGSIELDFRARLMTALREFKLWPSAGSPA